MPEGRVVLVVEVMGDLRRALTTSLTPRRRDLDEAAVGGGVLVSCLAGEVWERETGREERLEEGAVGVQGENAGTQAPDALHLRSPTRYNPHANISIRQKRKRK